MSVPRILVVGGNGFLGSAICRTAVAKGWDVSSMSSSGTPYKTPAGHTPKWVNSVTWHAASAFKPDEYRDILSDKTAVVHTLGILLEDSGYKKSVQSGDVLGVLKSVVGSLGDGNPLKTEDERRRGYEGMNRDSALKVLDTFMQTQRPQPSEDPKPFVYISAADAFRPVVPSRYIESKREAELGILQRTQSPDVGIRPLFIRPDLQRRQRIDLIEGLMYHPHIRPISTLPAFLLSLSASIPFPNPFATKSFLGSAIESLSTHPIHVDHVASAVIKSIEEPDTRGIVDLDTMRAWAGFEVGRKGTGLGPLSG